VRVVAVSDTHGLHERLHLPAADVIVHCGDLSRHGGRAEVEAAVAWIASAPARHKVVVAGNHDAFCEEEPDAMRALCARHGVHYLDGEAISLDGRRFWGSAATPAWRSMAFNRTPDQLAAHWRQVPDGLDVLVTHGPPRGVGDRMFLGRHVGCASLLEAVRARPPRVHLFGHIHEARGRHHLDGVRTRFENVAVKGLVFGARAPVVVDLEGAWPRS
jgi:Icc-related predicted phosphoesterase